MQRLPRFGEPVRVAFVGQETYFSQCAPHGPTAGLTPRFFDFRAGVGDDAAALRDALEDWGAHVVVVFRPEIVPPGAFAGLRAATLGFVTEPLRRAGGQEHPDLDWRESELALTDPANFDRVVAFDPHVAATADRHATIWRSLPLPVDDRLYAPVVASAAVPRILFIGYSTEHRERFLINATSTTCCTTPTGSTATSCATSSPAPTSRSTSTASPTRASRTGCCCTWPPGTWSSPSRWTRRTAWRRGSTSWRSGAPTS
jgi:hypothetical protein